MESIIFSTLASSKGKQIGIATLNAEKSLNALSVTMVDALTKQLTLWQQDPQIAAVLLDAVGDKAFCAGGDVRALYHARQQNPQHFVAQVSDFFEAEYRLDYQLHTFGKPVLVWGDGIVMGGGIGLLMGASHRIVTERSRLAMPEVTIGLYPDVGGTYFLSRMQGKLGLFLGLTAYNLTAADARYVGMANHFLASSEKQRLLHALTAVAWGENHSLNKQKLHDVLDDLEISSTEHVGKSRLKANQGLIDKLMDGRIGEIVSRMQQLASSETWLERAKATMLAGSPQSWLLADAQCQLGREMSLAECFRFELGLSINCCVLGDFCEGVRALLVDKDRQPQWAYGAQTFPPDSQLQALLTSPFSGDHPLADL
ncbi:enoyl-CoA hydratase/isomerase family protein [Shewanella avicenniae]|uniref:3-hydroxyisobutyryl-CoA hydrolase n=1 Tax=Shewanella avicenniae TaxID=2814294 RepID=A0ABX7QTX1_9GAMM|nr:enoyl-CoA hydratase/isomerase family protein [Shewanella avicenniae]QSX34936.1 enoyl-CoA hydratase/isomerase family protein [Shewanella avicenniae]